MHRKAPAHTLFAQSLGWVDDSHNHTKGTDASFMYGWEVNINKITATWATKPDFDGVATLPLVDWGL